MDKKVKNLIYLDTNRYISLSSLKTFYWASIILPIMMIVMGVVSIKLNGVNWKSIFPLASVFIWSLLYWIFIFIIQSKKTKKTFELRFLVNGISGLFLFSLFLLLYTSINLVADKTIVGFDFSLWILFFYLIFSIIYIALIILGVHKGIYKKIREKSQTPKALAISAFCTAIFPSMGVLGMYTSRALREYASVSVQNVVGTVCLVLVVFIPILGHINFVQYYYCKKYKILCDENGDTTSPELEPQVKLSKNKQKEKACEKADCSSCSATKKKIPLIVKILIGIISFPIILFVVVFLVLFIKEIILAIF